MDPISYSKAAQQEQRIKRIIAEPDSAAGLVSVPSVIASGETTTIPAGRVVVHPNLQVDGTLDVQGSLFVPAGGTLTQILIEADVIKQNGEVVATEAYVDSAIAAIPVVEGFTLAQAHAVALSF